MKILSKASTLAIIALLALIACRLYTTKAAPTPAQFWTPGCVATIPKAWGQFKGGDAQSGLAFEDNTGTLRFLDQHSMRRNSPRRSRSSPQRHFERPLIDFTLRPFRAATCVDSRPGVDSRSAPVQAAQPIPCYIALSEHQSWVF